MKKRELVITCAYSSEEISLIDIIQTSFLLYLRKELEIDKLAPSPSPQVR